MWAFVDLIKICKRRKRFLKKNGHEKSQASLPLLSCILLIINDQFPRKWFINLYPLPLTVRGASEDLFLIWNRPRYGNQTFADVIVSCFKIVFGFYQVISDIFTALARVKWQVTLIPMEKFSESGWKKYFSICTVKLYIYYQLRIDAFFAKRAFGRRESLFKIMFFAPS